MTWIFHETPDSGECTEEPRTEIRRYVCGRNGDGNYIRAYALAATPVILNGLFRQNVSVKHIGGGMWNVEVPYGTIEPPDPASYRIQFDTTGGTARITQAKEHIAHFPAGGDGHKGAINVTPDGRVEGCDVVIPQFKWTEEHTLTDLLISGWSYSQTLKALTGHVNQASFRGFGAGQVRFDGATGGTSNQNPGEWALTFQFVQQDDVSGLTVGDITGVEKDGWEYSWVEYEPVKDTTNNKMSQQPAYVHVERVYDAADFDLLLIGS